MNAFPPNPPRDRVDQPDDAGRQADPALNAALDRVFAAAPARPGLEARIAAAALAARAEAVADTEMAARLDAELVPAGVIPADLEANIHAASVGDLPGRRLVFADAAAARPQLAPTSAGQPHRWLGRLAMAASFGVVALVGLWTVLGPQSPDGPVGETGPTIVMDTPGPAGTNPDPINPDPASVTTPRGTGNAMLVSFDLDLDQQFLGDVDPREVAEAERLDYGRSVVGAFKIDSFDGIAAELSEAVPDAFAIADTIE